MKFANLVLQSPIIRSWHDLFPTAGRGQAALRHQPTPGEQLVWGNAMPTSHQAYRHTRLEGLFDHANLLRRRPAPPALNRRDDLNAIARIGHRHGVCLTLAKWETVSGQFGGYLNLFPLLHMHILDTHSKYNLHPHRRRKNRRLRILSAATTRWTYRRQ